MLRSGPLTAPHIVVLFLLALVLAAGCGGDQSSGSGAQDGGAEQQEGSPSATKVALGAVRGVQPDAQKVVLKPSTGEQGEGVVPFKLTKKAKITLGDQTAEISGIERGQQAQIEYYVENGVNRATTVQLFEAGGGEPTSGQPSGGEETTDGGEGTG